MFARAMESDKAQALGSLGVRLCLQNRHEDSRTVLNAALMLSPDDIELLNNLAVVFDRDGRTEQAIQTVECSLALSNTQPDSWIFLGNMKQKQGDLAGAATAFESAISLDATSALAWQGLGLVRQQQHEFAVAIECLRNCIRLNHVTAPILSVLGQLFYSTGQFEKSRDACEAAVSDDPQNPVYRRMLREMRFVCDMIDGSSIEVAINAYLIDHAGFTIEQDAEDLLHKSFALLSSYGYTDAARVVAEKRLALFPHSASAAYFVHAIRGDETLARSPDQYIIESFDKMAEHFDDHLTHALGYNIPQKLSNALIGFIAPGTGLDILDAGCGTGLCGPHLRPITASLTGVDLSQKMLEQARQKGIYDSLVCSELTSFLTIAPARFDLIIAADLVIYFGDLVPLAAGMALSLKPGGWVAFSTEVAESSGWRLLSSGRFAHDPAYIRSIFNEEFIECLCQETTVRLEAVRAVPGNIFVFRRR